MNSSCLENYLTHCFEMKTSVELVDASFNPEGLHKFIARAGDFFLHVSQSQCWEQHRDKNSL